MAKHKKDSPEDVLLSDEQTKLIKLRKENERLQMERETLKDVTIFCKENGVIPVVHYESTTLILFILFPFLALSHWMKVSAAILVVSQRANPVKLLA